MQSVKTTTNTLTYLRTTYRQCLWYKIYNIHEKLWSKKTHYDAVTNCSEIYYTKSCLSLVNQREWRGCSTNDQVIRWMETTKQQTDIHTLYTHSTIQKIDICNCHKNTYATLWQTFENSFNVCRLIVSSINKLIVIPYHRTCEFECYVWRAGDRQNGKQKLHSDQNLERCVHCFLRKKTQTKKIVLFICMTLS